MVMVMGDGVMCLPSVGINSVKARYVFLLLYPRIPKQNLVPLCQSLKSQAAVQPSIALVYT